MHAGCSQRSSTRHFCPVADSQPVVATAQITSLRVSELEQKVQERESIADIEGRGETDPFVAPVSTKYHS